MSDNVSPQDVKPVVDYEYSRQHSNIDEIDILDIWRIIVRQWRWIVATTLIFVTIALAYALAAPKVYKVEAFLLPPYAKDLAQLHIHDISDVSVGEAYAEAIKNLRSLSVRYQFFKENKLFDSLAGRGSDIDEQEVFIELFYDILKVEKGDDDMAGFVEVSFEGDDPDQIASWVNDFLVMVNKYTVDEFVRYVEERIKVKKIAIDNNIKGLRQVAENRRMDRIAVFEEAFAIAKDLGIVENADVFPSYVSRKNNAELGIAVNTSSTPLYQRGTKQLQSEIDIMRKRKSDDPFIESLRDLQVILAKLDQIKIDTDSVRTIRIDQLAVAPGKIVRPKRMLVVALGVALGFSLGILAAFIVDFRKSIRN